MQLSHWISISDLCPWKKTLFDSLILDRLSKKSLFLNGNEKHVLTSLKKSGVEGIELLLTKQVSNKDVEYVKSILKESNLSVLSAHQPLDPRSILSLNFNDIEALCQKAALFDAKKITLHASSIGEQLFNRHFIHDLYRLEKKYNVIFGLENNPKHPLMLFRNYAWKSDRFASAVKASGFHIAFDVLHLAQTGGEVLDFFIKNQNRIINIHLSDYKKQITNSLLLMPTNTHLPLGQGNLPINELLRTTKKARYKGLITMEINSDLESICESAKLIQSIYSS